MTWKTHLIGGAQIGVLAAGIAGGSPENSLIIVSAAMLGSVLPDIDQPGSRIARSDSLIGLISLLVSRFTKHRGFTHTLLGAFSMGILFFLPSLLRNGREGLIAYFAAVIIFLLIHASGEAISYLAGWIAAAAYVFGPHIASLLSGQSTGITLSEQSARLFAIGIMLGCISHMIYDSFNKGGVPWLWPASKKNFRLMSIKTNTVGEFYFTAVQILILAAIIAIFCMHAAVSEVGNGLYDAFSLVGRCI